MKKINANSVTATCKDAQPTLCTITASAGTGGTIIPPQRNGNRKPGGSSQTFTATSNSGKEVNEWLLNGSATHLRKRFSRIVVHSQAFRQG
jgi:hypothetical protein